MDVVVLLGLNPLNITIKEKFLSLVKNNNDFEAFDWTKYPGKVTKGYLPTCVINAYLKLKLHALHNIVVFLTDFIEQLVQDNDEAKKVAKNTIFPTETRQVRRTLNITYDNVKGKKLLIPANLEGFHWVLVVVDLQNNKKEIYFYDTIPSLDEGTRALELVQNFFKSCDIELQRVNNIENTEMPAPECGVMVIKNALAEAGQPTREDCTALRKTIYNALLPYVTKS